MPNPLSYLPSVYEFDTLHSLNKYGAIIYLNASEIFFIIFW
jgi:hypothetical protein